jgi:hypothetical protein
MITFSLATEEHARAVQLKLRAVDISEVAKAGSNPMDTVERSLEASLIAWTMFRDGRPIAVFGVAPHKGAPGVGIVWLLGTDELVHAGRSLVKAGHYYVALMHKLFPKLVNAIDPENKRTRRWLAALGFVEVADLPMKTGAVFRVIQREATHV